MIRLEKDGEFFDFARSDKGYLLIRSTDWAKAFPLYESGALSISEGPYNSCNYRLKDKSQFKHMFRASIYERAFTLCVIAHSERKNDRDYLGIMWWLETKLMLAEVKN